MNLDGIPIPLVGGGLGTLLFLVFFPYIQIARGRLVPRSTLEDVIRDRDNWHQAHTISETAREMQTEQNKEMLEIGRTTYAVIRSISHLRDAEGGSP